ncbi:unnamed protein product, partial [Polarella glacialis]
FLATPQAHHRRLRASSEEKEVAEDASPTASTACEMWLEPLHSCPPSPLVEHAEVADSNVNGRFGGAEKELWPTEESWQWDEEDWWKAEWPETESLSVRQERERNAAFDAFKGTWKGGRGETYTVEFQEARKYAVPGTCYRLQHGQALPYTVTFDLESGLLWWGLQKKYFLDPSELAQDACTARWYPQGQLTAQARRAGFEWSKLQPLSAVQSGRVFKANESPWGANFSQPKANEAQTQAHVGAKLQHVQASTSPKAVVSKQGPIGAPPSADRIAERSKLSAQRKPSRV